jgi:hypothetical protein
MEGCNTKGFAYYCGVTRSDKKIATHQSGFLSRNACFSRPFNECGKVSGRQSSTCSGSEEAIFRNVCNCSA